MSLPTESRPVILITGVSPGPSIGQSSALAFLSSGYRVFGTCRVGQLDLAKKLIHAGVEVVELELGDEGSLVKVARTVEERTGGRLDVLVNNVGT